MKVLGVREDWLSTPQAYAHLQNTRSQAKTESVSPTARSLPNEQTKLPNFSAFVTFLFALLHFASSRQRSARRRGKSPR